MGGGSGVERPCTSASAARGLLLRPRGRARPGPARGRGGRPGGRGAAAGAGTSGASGEGGGGWDATDSLGADTDFWPLVGGLSGEEDGRVLPYARSVADAQVLRRKGRLKEQDPLIDFIIELHKTHDSYEAMEKVERWIYEHHLDPRRSQLKKLIPSIGTILHPLPLSEALSAFDRFGNLSARKHVPPNFAEIRHVLNLAQVRALAPSVQLICSDADGTLYGDGQHLEQDCKMVDRLVALMRAGIKVAIVTAAGYEEAEKFEARIPGLLSAFERLPKAVTDNFYFMGGECNYLLQVAEGGRLEFVPPEEWGTPDMLAWTAEDIAGLLDEAEAALLCAARRMRVPVQLIRKPRAVGVVPTEPTIYEVLEEIALTVQDRLSTHGMPHCAFNGGGDVFVDVGHKGLGITALARRVDVRPDQIMHVGDRFTVTGNDKVAKSKFSILWVANPDETAWYFDILQQERLAVARLGGPAAAAAGRRRTTNVDGVDLTIPGNAMPRARGR